MGVFLVFSKGGWIDWHWLLHSYSLSPMFFFYYVLRLFDLFYLFFDFDSQGVPYLPRQAPKISLLIPNFTLSGCYVPVGTSFARTTGKEVLRIAWKYLFYFSFQVSLHVYAVVACASTLGCTALVPVASLLATPRVCLKMHY